MNTLFDVRPNLPEGFTYTPDFISAVEEERLLKNISTLELHTFHFQGFEAKRRVASYGYDWSFEKRVLTKGKAIPEMFAFLIERVAAHLGVEKTAIGELLVLEYPVGAVINWHRDAPPFDQIAGISLKSDCTFRLRPYEKLKQRRGSIKSLLVKPRSLYVMQGESRSEWEHSTLPVKSVRYSITFRTLKEKA
jgi:alkylated DNA repair dioxygenase AlkB